MDDNQSVSLICNTPVLAAYKLGDIPRDLSQENKHVFLERTKHGFDVWVTQDKNIPVRYDVLIVHHSWVGSEIADIFYMETRSGFTVDLEREITTPEDFPVSLTKTLVIIATSNTRTYLGLLSSSSPIGPFSIGFCEDNDVVDGPILDAYEKLLEG